MNEVTFHLCPACSDDVRIQLKDGTHFFFDACGIVSKLCKHVTVNKIEIRCPIIRMTRISDYLIGSIRIHPYTTFEIKVDNDTRRAILATIVIHETNGFLS